MVEVSATTTIDAPLAEVFAYMDRPENQPEITPSLTRSERLEELPNGGKRVAYTYTMGGIDLDGEIAAVEYDPESRIRWEMSGDLTGEIEAVEYDPESRIRWEMSGDLTGEIEWTFEETDDGTEVTYASTYEVPVPVVGRLAEPFVERYNERELRTTLENLRTRIETGSA